MCGRYGLTIDQEAIAIAYGVEVVLTKHEPRYNIAPSQEVPVLLDDRDGRRVTAFRWGLIPPSAVDPKFGYRTINARSETVSSRPAFRAAWREGRRCLILADGFYEWQAPPGGQGRKIPYWIQLDSGRPFGFAGLWERWRGDGAEILSCTVLTTDASKVLAPIHDRMPVILADPGAWNAWVDPDVPSQTLREMLEPFPSDGLKLRPVSTYVNRPENEGPECLAPPKDDIAEEGESEVLTLDL